MKELESQLLQLETALTESETRSSREQLDRLLAEDFLEIGSSGKIFTKAHALERLPASTEKNVYEISHFHIRVLSPDLVQTIFKTKRTTDGTDILNSLRTSLWRKNGNTWQMLYHQGTPIRND